MEQLNILLYGNCQMEALNEFFIPNPHYKIHLIKCFLTELTQSEFTSIIKNMDIIIMHITEDEYRNKHYLSTTYIINLCKPEAKLILITNLYFSYYYFDSYFNNNSEFEFDFKMCKEYMFQNKTKESYLKDVIYNENFKNSKELDELSDYCFNELNKRYENIKLYKDFYKEKDIYLINMIPFIKENYKKELLFYTINHPTIHLLNELCNKINNCLKYYISIDKKKDFFSYHKCILYKCLQKDLDFDISKYLPKVKNCIDIESVVDLYFQSS